MRSYQHKGALGDILYSLPTVIATGGGIYYVRKHNQWQFMHKLLETQKYLAEVRPGTPKHVDYNLDLYRDISRHDPELYLPYCHAAACNVTVTTDRAWLNGISPLPTKKIVVNRTKRYHGRLDYSLLKKYEADAGFVGFYYQFEDFCKRFDLNIHFIEIKDALNMARVILGSRVFIGNQSLAYAIAESAKHPRVLEVSDKKPNCGPHGPQGHTKLTERLLEHYTMDT